MLKRVCLEWKEIALVCRDRVFEESEQEDIDLFDIKCKEWGFLLKELFGSGLGTGDYAHLTIDHAPMLMRRFLTMKDYSQQGFEASHKDQRQLWLKASSHDCKGECASVEQMLVHFYAEKTLFLRYCFQEALRAIQDGTGANNFNFHFRGCGWKNKTVTWDEGEQLWIKVVNHLYTMMFGKDHYEYEYNEKKVCVVAQDSQPNYKYDREQWNDEYEDIFSEEATNDHVEGDTSKKRKLHSRREHLTMECTEGTLSSKKPRLTGRELQGKDSNGSGDPKPTVNILAASTAIDNQGNQDRVIATFPDPPSQNRVTVLQMDLDTLEDGQELNDAIIDFFVLYTSNHVSDKDAIDKCHFFSSFFYTKLSERVVKGKGLVLPSDHERHSRACSFTRRVDVFKKEFLFIPVCRSGHWFLLLVHNLPLLETRGANQQTRSFIFVLDSIAWSNRSIPSPREHEAEMIRSFLRCEWVAKKRSTLQVDEKSLPLVYPKVPQQDNGYDCGVYVLLFLTEFLQRKLPVAQLLSDEVLQWYDQGSAVHLRLKIREILLELEGKRVKGKQ
ncbi:uncharacterized protein LOC122954217 isoform X1 [Acropora millepora]|uniref:uncharacterized protein LOC122954217 isoform X1 n=1 Tax=Acropora millepora TaxID=45264 RepID=UPI001CF49ACC|nr:uncharacterized protein LOC122954217 isoform X1 [Acropora millepora]